MQVCWEWDVSIFLFFFIPPLAEILQRGFILCFQEQMQHQSWTEVASLLHLLKYQYLKHLVIS